MFKKNIKIYLAVIGLAIVLAIPAGISLAEGVNASKPSFNGIVPCGTDSPCTLCHLIVGIQRIIQWGMYMLTTAALVGLFIGGAMYLVSGGDEKMIGSAKSFIGAVLKGFAVVLGAWLIINIIFWVLPNKADLGIQNEGWFKLSCSTVSSIGDGIVPAPKNETDGTVKTQATLLENEPCVAGKAPYCKPGLACTGGKCIPDDASIATCGDPKTQWVKINDCSSLGINLADWNCTACKGKKPDNTYKCCGNVTQKPAPPVVQGGCCVGPKGSYTYTMCSDGQSFTQNDCYFMTNSGNVPGEYFANKKCVDITVNGNKRKACQ